VAVDEDGQRVVLASDFALCLKAVVNMAVDRKTALVVRRDDQTGIGVFQILPCDRLEALVGVGIS